MPRPFSPVEAVQIRDRLKEAGRDAFVRRGLSGTTVEGLARAAGISKGAFYRFHDSKESLLLALLDEDELAMHAQIEQAVSADPAGGIDLVVDTALRAAELNPLVPILMSEEGRRLLRARPPEEVAALLERDVRLVDRVLAVLQEAGAGLDVPPAALLGLLRSLVFVGLHRSEIGDEQVEEMSAWLKASLRAGLTTTTPGRTS